MLRSTAGGRPTFKRIMPVIPSQPLREESRVRRTLASSTWVLLVSGLLTLSVGWVQEEGDLARLAATLRAEHPKLLLPGPRAGFDNAVKAAGASLRGADRRHT